MTTLLVAGPKQATAWLLLGHGAGAGMTSPFMELMTGLLTVHGIGILRFEFAYMAARRDGGKRRPPPKAELLAGEYRDAVAAARGRIPAGRPLMIGGKSMGGRIASLVADELHAAGTVRGLVCLGYPFHPTGKPEQLRTAHLIHLACPALIVQGDRDPFGNRAEVEALLSGPTPLSPAIRLHWADDGDHDFGPRGASGFTRTGNLEQAADAVAAFVAATPAMDVR